MDTAMTTHATVTDTARPQQRPKILDRALESRLLREARFAERIGRLPYFRQIEGASLTTLRAEGRELLNLASNNYLALTTSRRMIQAMTNATQVWGTGVTGSRLMNGNLRLHEQLETEISDFFGREAALLFPTGYTANLGLLAALLRPQDAVIIDSEVHASCHDGIRLSGAERIAVVHNDVGDFSTTLSEVEATMCVIEGAYSMSGDIAPVADIAALCRRSATMLIVDEAHALGVLGPRGLGASELTLAEPAVDAITITFSKSLGSCGGAVIGSGELIEYLRYAARPFMFTASNTPGSLAAALTALHILRDHPEYPREVCELGAAFAAKLKACDVTVRYSGSAIISVPCGSDFRTTQAWKMLWNRGIFCNASISPAVPRGRGSLRFSVMRTHDTEELLAAAEVCAEVLLELKRVIDDPICE